MSTRDHPVRPGTADRTIAADDDLRFERFWGAFDREAGSPTRWMSSAASAWGHRGADAAAGPRS